MNLQIKPFYLFLIFLLLNSSIVQSQTGVRPALLVKDSSLTKNQRSEGRGVARFFKSTTTVRIENQEIDKFLVQYPGFLQFEENLRIFYNKRQTSFVWFDQKGLIEQAGNLFNRLSNLVIQDNEDIPHLNALDSLLNINYSSKFTGVQKIKLELMLTAQYCVLAELSSSEKYPDLLNDINWKPKGQKLSYQEYLDYILNKPVGKVKVGESIINRQYELLKKQLEKFRELDKNGTYSKIELEKPSYRFGDSSEVIKQIKLKLFELGDYQNKYPDLIFDLQLENAVKQFQNRHGLLDDGIIGKATLAELNVPYKQRIKQLIVNMERCLWLPENLSTDYLAVNIPEFKLHVFSNNQLQWSCKVVVGKVMNKTVVFNADLKYVVFSPYWNVPQSIVRNEILKDMRRDRNYLIKHQMEITSYRNGLPEIRQKPGSLNALGKVKFLFPNSYNIYLHDTPTKSLFNEPIRAFSHGCIRISEPFKLAQFLLRNQSNWDDAAIQEAMDSGKEKYVSLKDKVSVFIVYFTSFVDSEGRINFRKDIYGRDKRLADMIIDF